jgi:hypothetical protein
MTALPQDGARPPDPADLAGRPDPAGDGPEHRLLILLGVYVDPALLAGCAIANVLGGLLGAPLGRASARVESWTLKQVQGDEVKAAAVLLPLVFAPGKAQDRDRLRGGDSWPRPIWATCAR